MALLKACPLCGANAVRQMPLATIARTEHGGYGYGHIPMVTCSSVYRGEACPNGQMSVPDADWQANTGSLLPS